MSSRCRVPRSVLRSCWLWTLLLAGCATTFSPGAAREISRERLLSISEKGTTNHLQYMGSDFNYHYVFDARSGKERSYKIRTHEMKLAATFSVGEDSYVLYPWVIEGQPFGAPPADVGRKPSNSEKKEGTSALPASRTAQPVVEGAAESRLGKSLGDDEPEPGGVESP
jgi:hypothetical protein